MTRRRLPEQLYRVGEVIEYTGLSRQPLQYYAPIVLIRERRRTAAGYRLFAPSIFARLERIRALQKRGFTLREIRGILESGRHAPRRTAAKTKTATKTSRSGTSRTS